MLLPPISENYHKECGARPFVAGEEHYVMNANTEAIINTRGLRVLQILAVMLAMSLCLSLAAAAFADLGPTDNVFGTVSDAAGDAVANVRVDLIAVPRRGGPFTAATVRTDSAGEWSATVPTGRYLLKFSTDDGSYASVYYPDSPTVADAYTIDLGTWLTSAGSAVVYRAASISGEMTDMFNGEQMADAPFVLEGRNKSGVWRTIATGTTDAEGRFSAGGLNPGAYIISTPIEGAEENRYLGQETASDCADILNLSTAQVLVADFTVCTDVAAPRTSSDITSRSLPCRSVVNFNAVDDKSGVAVTYYRVNRGRMMTGSAVMLTRLGFNTIQFYSVDAAGNTEVIRRQIVLVTRPSPTK